MSAGPPPWADQLLAPALEAGWEWAAGPRAISADTSPDDRSATVGSMSTGEIEPDENGPWDFEGVLARGISEVAVECWDDVLTLGPTAVPHDAGIVSLLERDVSTDIEEDLAATVTNVRSLTATVGMLDVVDVAARGRGTTSTQLMSELMLEFIVEPAATGRGVSSPELLVELSSTVFTQLLDLLPMTRRRPVPEAVPPIAALAIAGFGWRDTAVEDAHVIADNALTDPVMAKLNIAATRIARRHCSTTGIDWSAITTELLDADRTIADGRRVIDLFGPEWTSCADSVSTALRRLREVEQVLGPAPTVRYLSMVGSLPATSRWWGTGIWHGLCRTVLDTRAEAGVPLPAPYDRRGVDALYADLLDVPDELSDEVLRFCTDPLEFEERWLHGLRDAPLPLPAVVEFVMSDA